MPGGALKMALAAYLQPSLLRIVGTQPIPNDAITVIRVAAGDDEVIKEYAKKHDTSSQTIKDACVLYLRTVIASAGQDHYRLLLLPAGADTTQIKSHSRWLLKWLHPDLNKSAWESALFLRVRDAAKKLEKSINAELSQPNAEQNEKKLAKNEIGRHRKRRKKLRLQLVSRGSAKSQSKLRIWFSKKRVTAGITLFAISVASLYFFTGAGHGSLQELLNTLFG